MKKSFLIYLALFLASCAAPKLENLIKQTDAERIILKLSA